MRSAFSGQGIIPAYAGSTCRATTRSRWSADHPRLRGEHHDITTALAYNEGSSPPTRGARLDCSLKGAARRIIPAYAGSTVRCGYQQVTATGSSPPTRGALLDRKSFSH